MTIDIKKWRQRLRLVAGGAISAAVLGTSLSFAATNAEQMAAANQQAAADEKPKRMSLAEKRVIEREDEEYRQEMLSKKKDKEKEDAKGSRIKSYLMGLGNDGCNRDKDSSLCKPSGPINAPDVVTQDNTPPDYETDRLHNWDFFVTGDNMSSSTGATKSLELGVSNNAGNQNGAPTGRVGKTRDFSICYNIWPSGEWAKEIPHSENLNDWGRFHFKKLSDWEIKNYFGDASSKYAVEAFDRSVLGAQTIQDSNDPMLKSVGTTKDSQLLAEIRYWYRTYTYRWGKSVNRGISLLEQMRLCLAVRHMTSYDRTAPEKGTAMPQSMMMAFMMSSMGFAGGAGATGKQGDPTGGAMSMLSATANPIIGLMLGGGLKCEANGPETQDWNVCKNIVNAFDGFVIAQQTAMMAENATVIAQTVSARTAIANNNGKDPTIQLEKLQELNSYATGIAIERAALQFTKSAAFIALLNKGTSAKNLTATCIAQLNNDGGGKENCNGEVQYLKYLEDITKAYFGILNAKFTEIISRSDGNFTPPSERTGPGRTRGDTFHDIDSMSDADAPHGLSPGIEQEKRMRKLRYDTTMNTCTEKIALYAGIRSSWGATTGTGSDYRAFDGALQVLNDVCKSCEDAYDDTPNWNNEALQACEKGVNDSLRALEGLTTRLPTDGESEVYFNFPKFPRKLKNKNHSYQDLFDFILAPSWADPDDTKTRSSPFTPATFAGHLVDWGIQWPNPVLDTWHLWGPKTQDIHSFQPYFEELLDQLGNAYNTYGLSVRGALARNDGERLCSFYEDYLPNSYSLTLAKIIAGEAGMEGLANSAIGVMSHNQGQQIGDTIQRLKDLAAELQQTPIATADNYLIEECQVTPSLPQCTLFNAVNSNSLQFGGAMDLTIGGGGKGNVIAAAGSGTSGGSQATSYGTQKGSADQTRVGGGVGDIHSGISRRAGGDLDASGKGLARVKSQIGGGGGSGGGSGGGGSAIPGGGPNNNTKGAPPAEGIKNRSDRKLAYDAVKKSLNTKAGFASSKSTSNKDAFDGMWKKSDGAKGGSINFRDLASQGRIGDQGTSIFDRLSERYKSIMSNKRLIEYEVVEEPAAE
jgi:hypothetical protein